MALNQKVNQKIEKFNSLYQPGYAGISACQSITWANPVASYRSSFLSGKAGQRDGVRAAAHVDAAALPKTVVSRVLAFFLSLGRAGYNGSIAPEDILADCVALATGSKCGERSFRSALTELCRCGWLAKSPVCTGNKKQFGGSWRSLAVLRISLTPKALLLIAKGPAITQKKRAPLRAKKNLKGRKNLPAMVVNKPLPLTGVKGCLDTTTKTESSCSHGQSERLTNDCDKSQNRKPKSNRDQFLSDIVAFLATSNNFGPRLKVASAHSHPDYPTHLPRAFDTSIIADWDKIDSRERARVLQYAVIPDLESWCDCSLMPDCDGLTSLADKRHASKLTEWKGRKNLLLTNVEISEREAGLQRNESERFKNRVIYWRMICGEWDFDTKN